MNTSAERAVLRQLHKVCKETLTIVQRWSDIVAETTHLDSIINQLEQRDAVLHSGLSNSGLPFSQLPDFRETLIARIDLHISELCLEVNSQLNELQKLADKLCFGYTTAGELFEKYGHEFRSSSHLNLINQRTATRPSINELFSWLDETCLQYKHELEQKKQLFQSFTPTNVNSLHRLRRSWPSDYKWQQRFNADILPFVKAFLEFNKSI